LLAEIRCLNVLGEQLVRRDRTPVAEVAVVGDKKSVAPLNLAHEQFKEQFYRRTLRWGHLGIPFDSLWLDDPLAPPGTRYQLTVAALVQATVAGRRLAVWHRRDPQLSLA
jgi:hypothetical protein